MSFIHPAVSPVFIAALDWSRAAVLLLLGGVRHLGNHLIHLLHMRVVAEILRGIGLAKAE